MSAEKKQDVELFVATAELLNATLSYLSKRPYAEVAGLVERLMKVTPYHEQQGKKMENFMGIERKDLDGE